MLHGGDERQSQVEVRLPGTRKEGRRVARLTDVQVEADLMKFEVGLLLDQGCIVKPDCPATPQTISAGVADAHLNAQKQRDLQEEIGRRACRYAAGGLESVANTADALNKTRVHPEPDASAE